jgi:anti-anti-sigma factor
MDISYRIDKDILYIAIEGRIDASNAPEAEQKIFAIKNENADKHLVIDADKLEYLSSAGLRVILRLRKEFPKLAIINVSPEVYSIFEMTGFTEMVTIEKAYRKMSVDGCEFIAKGANGAVYRYDNETILKIYFAKDALPEIKQERENAKRAFVLGINTAIPYGIVRVGDGYGTVTELLNATSVTKLICKNTSDMTEACKYYIDMLKSIHGITVEDGVVPDMKETALSWADFVSKHIPSEQAIKLKNLIEAVPKTNNLLHGD